VEKKEFVWAEEPRSGLRRTPLFEEHKRLGAKFVPFAGWEMPVWYTSVSEEHRAVREAAGLFDVGHMGVLEVAGEHATSLLDLATTNYVRWLEPGESQYTYLLDPDGRVIDDLIVYCRSRERYLLVVNAINAEKDLAWLRAINSGEYLLDRRRAVGRARGAGPDPGPQGPRGRGGPADRPRPPGAQVARDPPEPGRAEAGPSPGEAQAD
jgi:glycine hydroxymethyltransferase